jgi:hypothetical protein
MPNNKISPAFLSTTHQVVHRDAAPRFSLAARLTALLRAGHFDRQLAVGVPPCRGSALAVHEMRLTTVAEREAIAGSLRNTMREARSGASPLTSRVPLNPTNIIDAEDLIDTVTLRLHSPQPVSARGMARLRVLLADGCGPLYRFGHGDLKGRLGAALAAL